MRKDFKGWKFELLEIPPRAFNGPYLVLAIAPLDFQTHVTRLFGEQAEDIETVLSNSLELRDLLGKSQGIFWLQIEAIAQLDLPKVRAASTSEDPDETVIDPARVLFSLYLGPNGPDIALRLVWNDSNDSGSDFGYIGRVGRESSEGKRVSKLIANINC